MTKRCPSCGSPATGGEASQRGEGPSCASCGAPRAAVSAIRAQDGARAPVDPALGTRASAEGWWVRVEGGEVRSFDDLEAARAWLGGRDEGQVEISQDGRVWHSPEQLLGRKPKARRRDAELSQELVALGVAGSGHWSLAFSASLVLLASVGALTLHNFTAVELPLFYHLAPLSLVDAPPAAAAPLLGELGVDELAALAQAARAEGRLVDAALAYRRALAYGDRADLREGLAAVFVSLGATDRAEALRSDPAEAPSAGPAPPGP